jgi:hypothetical protein
MLLAAAERTATHGTGTLLAISSLRSRSRSRSRFSRFPANSLLIPCAHLEATSCAGRVTRRVTRAA